MTPQQPTQQTNQNASSTSRWTDAFYSGKSHPTGKAAHPASPEHAHEDEAQAPTHDALSSIYNRGY